MDRSYTMSDCERLARTIPWRVADPVAWFLDCPGSELCDGYFDWRDPEMCIVTKAIVFGLLRRIHEKEEEMKRLKSRIRRMRWIMAGLWVLFGIIIFTYAV